jgi:cob(I)alamin adenosyltransferase
VVKIYTRKGDDGTTSLWYGGRVPKTSLRTEAYGTLDEAASLLGVARSLSEEGRLRRDILRVQNELFVAGAELATAPQARERLQPGISQVTEAMVTQAEADIDSYMSEVTLPPNFVIPGGTTLSAQLDVARAVLRRSERRIVALADVGELSGSQLLPYVNRAADLLFAMARYADTPEPELFEGRSGRNAEQ